MNLYNNMEFEMKSCFIPNLAKSESLKIIEVNPGSIVVQMYNPDCRGVFPLDSFQYWIKKGSLIEKSDHQKKTS
ncbi:hypothetical protein RRV45_12430 [Bacillus sp. DTU_2020_1000418_1_SI_GHA_SEK_038]|uniref:hypothetical protein n=1 Tax=Bacillus sp. DTU_2020_1000418_1_SI_GHA_SEK_038 TaxID=3077585 RepID=UPI0028EB6021|nr:hypothetical protein [Bacillus sp. DTU_2020_1000418_1_SI_GHA_SEK_038]WNS73725.1 hypothetical protein RRV45_12430 [Bacillus sp. DTU_2020_1000418_1_SI_GHA_SEK_038]